ncbi:MAG: type III pantothenate kinase [Bacteroidia bacterium]
MLFADIGNTRIKTWYNGEMQTWTTPQELQAYAQGKGRILFLDVRRQPIWREVLCAFPHYEFTAQTPWPIFSDYAPTLGVDRKAALVFAHAQKIFPCLVICAGSAITYDFLDSTGYHREGMISPGMTLRYKALHQNTGLLPYTEPVPQLPSRGIDTLSALQKGVQQGLRYEIEGFCASLGPRITYLTGGEAYLVQKWLDTVTFVPDLIFQGMRLWYEKVSS